MNSIICFDCSSKSELFKLKLNTIPRANEYIIYNGMDYIVHFVIHTEYHTSLLVRPCKSLFN